MTDLEYMQNIVNQLTIDDFNDYNPDANGISDDMSMWLVSHRKQNNLSLADAEDSIELHFDEVVVMFYNRCKELNIAFNNKLPQDYVTSLNFS
jgi:hypothetical protein